MQAASVVFLIVFEHTAIIDIYIIICVLNKICLTLNTI